MHALKPTQIEVLKVLSMFPAIRMGATDIKKHCSLNPVHILNAIKYLASIDYVYQPDMQGKVQISPDGKAALL